MRSLLGGKGANVAEMLRIGVPVPDGFTVTTEACVAATRDGKWPDGLEAEIEARLVALEERTGRKLGEGARPLLVSVRSGAVHSMPGMMDTILNLGMSEATAEALAAESGNARFAWDSYRRFVQMYGEVVEGVPGDVYEHALSRRKSDRGVRGDTDLDADDLRALGAEFRRLTAEHGGTLPDDPREQLRGAVDAVFRSWRQPARHGLPAGARHLRRPRHRRQRHADGVRQPRRRLGDRRLLHPQPLDRRARGLRRVPGQRPGRGRRRGYPHAPAAARARGGAAGVLRAADRDDGAARGSLPRHAGHRVHDRARHALPAADAHRQAHHPGRAAHRARPRGRGRDRARGGGRAHRPARSRPAAAPDHRSGAPRRARWCAG